MLDCALVEVENDGGLRRWYVVGLLGSTRPVRHDAIEYAELRWRPLKPQRRHCRNPSYIFLLQPQTACHDWVPAGAELQLDSLRGVWRRV